MVYTVSVEILYGSTLGFVCRQVGSNLSFYLHSGTTGPSVFSTFLSVVVYGISVNSVVFPFLKTAFPLEVFAWFFNHRLTDSSTEGIQGVRFSLQG